MTLPHRAQRKHAFWVLKTNEKDRSNKVAPRNKFALELLHHIFGRRYTISLMAGDTANVWQDVGPRIYLDPFSHHVRYMQ